MGRHKVQTLVIGMVLLIATASATLGLALLSVTSAPFQHAFAAQNGAHLAVTADASRVSAAQAARTASLPGVTGAAGPFPQVTAQAQQDGQLLDQLVLTGRSVADEKVDSVVISQGHWPDATGQVALNGHWFGVQLGSTISVAGVSLTVVGLANSITGTSDGWVTPAQISALHLPIAYQMLYRFSQAATYAQMRSDIAEVTGALPRDAVTGTANWLNVQDQSEGDGAIMEPFVVAFALIGLAMAVLIVGNVISGAVVAGYHRIGVLKSIGLSPAQVITVYLSRVGWPALAGCVAGVAAGNVLAIPVLHKSAEAYQVGSQQVPWWASVVAPLGMLGLTMLAAFAPALRAGRLSAAAAIAAGRAPRTGRGYLAHRLAARLPLPRPVSLGLAAPFARPARTMVTLAAIAFGATAVIFAFGLDASLSRAQAAQTHSAGVQVQVLQMGPGAGPNGELTANQSSAVARVLSSARGVRRFVTEYQTQVNVPGVSRQVNAVAYTGDATWLGYGIISGRWYHGTGEAVVNTRFLEQSGLRLGDTFTVTTGSSPVTVRIAGEIFRPSRNPGLVTSVATLPGLATPDNLSAYDVGLRPGTGAAAFAHAVNRRLGSGSPFGAISGSVEGGQFYLIATALIGLLALMVAVAAGLGVLNTVLMTTRDRVHDLGVVKALGMRPRQMLTMVVCWILGPAVLAAVIAAPCAVLLSRATLQAMASTAHTGIPASFNDVFPPGRLALLSLAALAVAAIGALPPATWAARARAAAALRAE